jgi:hypothetical protein
MMSIEYMIRPLEGQWAPDLVSSIKQALTDSADILVEHRESTRFVIWHSPRSEGADLDGEGIVEAQASEIYFASRALPTQAEERVIGCLVVFFTRRYGPVVVEEL